jgi:cobalt-zinc-cadmium efflux system membrane fusion protein
VRFEGKDYIFISLGKRQEGETFMNDFEMVELIKGNEEDGYIAIDLKNASL